MSRVMTVVRFCGLKCVECRFHDSSFSDPVNVTRGVVCERRYIRAEEKLASTLDSGPFMNQKHFHWRKSLSA